MSRRYTLSDLAELFSVRLVGDGAVEISCVADLEFAEKGSISFFIDKKFQSQLKNTRASAVVISENKLSLCSKPALVSDNPHALFAEIATLLHPDEDMEEDAGIHDTAAVDPTATIHDTAIVAANSVIGAYCVVDEGVYIGPGCVLKQRVRVKAHSKLSANVTICKDCKIGERAIIHPGAVIGSDGFGFAHKDSKWIKVPQLGTVVIGDDVEIGAGVAIDRGALRDTVIENGVKLDNQIHIAHNVTIGENTVMAAQSGIAGSTRIGKDCAIAGAVGILGHLELADGTTINAFSEVPQSIMEPGIYASGTPLEPVAQWRKNRVRYKQLDEMARKLKDIERKLENLDKK
ncbi:MAG: UDP-3-O-(3-hydroxymyristoyl)glucosamine N-acyltransferase [Gammaproteobacteria bacterium]|nr:UDP-3-O-(3-hydroxymyristoyl)glucosamine N-acyltransferase [Gammaproteobacteria bacterium]